MRRPFSFILAIFMLGIILGKLQAYSVVISIILVCLGLLLSYKDKRNVIFFIIIIITFSYWTSSLQISKESTLSSLHNEKIKMEAHIIKPPIVKENKKEVFLQIKEIEVQGKKYFVNEKVLANIYHNEDNIENNISEGDYIGFQGKIVIPKGIRNPGGFYYSFYLSTKGVYATITIAPETIEIKDEKSLGIIWDFIFKVKRNIVKVIDGNLSEDHSELLKGILFGEKELDSHIRNTFVDSGIAHILAVSGLHVGFLVTFVFYITSLFKVSNPIKITIMTIVLIFYILITGASASVMRASIMAWLYLFSKTISKKYDGISAMSLAGLIILISNPLLLFTASFQLSFLAVLSIILFYPILLQYILKIKYIPNFIGKLMAVTIAAQIGTLPVALYHFHQVSIISVITNLLIIPSLGILLITSIMAILFYFIFPIIGKYLFFLAGFIFKWIILIAERFSSIPFSSISLPSFTWQGIIIYIFLCFMIGKYIPMKIKKVKVLTYSIVFLLLLLSFVQYLLPTPLSVTFLDVHQGDSILIETPNHKTILIDGGGYRKDQMDRKISKEVLLPAFYSKKINALDFVILTHPHDDHMKGIEELVGEIPIKSLGVYKIDHENMGIFLEKVKINNIPIFDLVDGDSIKIGGDIEMKVLSPEKDALIVDGQKDVNNASIVIRMDYYKRSFLFTGDIEREIEDQLVEDGKDIKIDVLKVAHHGSNSSSSESFLNQAQPNVSVISVGENNTFGHPDEKTIEQLKKIPSNIYRTDEKGAIEITTNGHWLKVKSYVDKK